MLSNVREPLLEEARRSPALLSDLAGLEQYVAESYDSRSFVELLQNADDAGATRFLIKRNGDSLIVANDGRPFNRSDLESLCRSAASSKSRGTSVGYRGIGFKSVVGFAGTIHLITGNLEVTFSRELTALEVPEAMRVPLIRIPHRLSCEDRGKFSATITELLGDGLITAFIFDHLLAAGIETEFASFDATSLLFLRNVRRFEMQGSQNPQISVRREAIDSQTRNIQLTSSDVSSQWLVSEENGVELAFKQGADGIVRLDENEAVVHAYLPTLEPTGFPFKIHGDFSTDPSRTRIVFDDRTSAALSAVAGLFMTILDRVLSGCECSAAFGIVNALVPFSDPRMASFQRRSFKTELLSAIQICVKGRFDKLRFRPTWINAGDFETLSEKAGIWFVSRSIEGIDGLLNFLRFVGVKEATFEELSPALIASEVTVLGAAEVVAQLTQRHVTKSRDVKPLIPDWHLWPVNGRMLTLWEAKKEALPLDVSFVDVLLEKCHAIADTYRLIAAVSDLATATALLPQGLTPPQSRVNHESVPLAPSVALDNSTGIERLSLKKWRSAEQQVMNLLHASGWTVEDVSRQNIGYDIEGRMPDREPVFVEVKAINHPGQPFTLTSNEEAVARQKGSKYMLAIVHQSGDFLEVAFIRNPVQHLKLTRQCRQWVWECAEYTFDPQSFPLG